MAELVEPKYPALITITVAAHPTDRPQEADLRIKFTGPDDLKLDEALEVMRGAVVLMELEQQRQAGAEPRLVEGGL